MYCPNSHPTSVSGNSKPKRPTTHLEDFEKAAKTVHKRAQMIGSTLDWRRFAKALYGCFRGPRRRLWILFPANPHYQDNQREISQNNKKGGY